MPAYLQAKIKPHPFAVRIAATFHAQQVKSRNFTRRILRNYFTGVDLRAVPEKVLVNSHAPSGELPE